MIKLVEKVRERKLFSILWLFITVVVVSAILIRNFMGIGTAMIVWLILTYQVLKD